VSNIKAAEDLGDNAKRTLISKICRQCFSRHRKEFEAISIFDMEDLEQEVWCSLLESNTYSGEDDIAGWAVRCLDNILKKGSRRVEIVSITPVSQLPHKDRRRVENIMYGGSEGGYDEESQP
jgi:DNA-directed RNA polymerase specialized sigma24 family protein